MSKRRFVLIVAVSDYPDNQMRLPGVLRDAQRLRWTLENYADGGVYRFFWLTNSEATKERILGALCEIARQANAADQIVIYFGGHGARYVDKGRRISYRLLPYDANFDNALTHGISPTEIHNSLMDMSAAEIIFIFDCCHSGGMMIPFWDKKYLEDLRSGWHSCFIMAAARGVDEAGEDDWGGFFMPALCDALQGERVTPNEEGCISAQVAWARAADMVREEARRHHHVQIPVNAGINSPIYLTRREQPLLRPCFYHLYPATKSFVGRTKERKMLTEWFTGPDAPPVFVMDAIGGMGKTALAWKWMNDDLLYGGLKPDGVFWWSFYESDATFESFVKCALAYFGGKDYEPDLSLGRPWRHLINLLQERRCLLVLDGVERRLRAYEHMNSVYQGDDVKPDPDGRFRECVSPDMRDFLVALLAPRTRAKVLLTTRLTPRELDDKEGCLRHLLEPMSKEDTVTYFRARGITEDKATRAEIEFACDRYGYHPLALTLLVGAVIKDPKFRGNICNSKHIKLNFLPTEPHRSHDILELAYNALAPELRQFISQLAAFRFAFDYQMVEDIFGGQISDLHGAMMELEERGFLIGDSEWKRFDMHPVVRQYAYDLLMNKTSIHTRMRNYFAAIPELDTDRVQSVEDLMPVIELYHHTIRVGWYDKAYELFRARLDTPLYFRFGDYRTYIELLNDLFLEGEEYEPRLVFGSSKQLLCSLGNAYIMSGQLRRAVSLHEKVREPVEKSSSDYRELNLSIVLGNLAGLQIKLGELAEAERNLRCSIKLCQEIMYLFGESVQRNLLALLLTYQGRFEEAAGELDVAIHKWRTTRQNVGHNWANRALRFLMIRDTKAALDAAFRAWEAGERANIIERVEFDVIQAEWLWGAALVALATKKRWRRDKTLQSAESLLTEALTRCRRINLVELEAYILLEWSRLRRLQGEREEALALAQEVLHIADRCEYRLQQADIHNFLAQFYLDEARSALNNEQRRVTLMFAREHAEKGKERAWCDGPPYCYKPALEEAKRLLEELGQEVTC